MHVGLRIWDRDVLRIEYCFYFFRGVEKDDLQGVLRAVDDGKTPGERLSIAVDQQKAGDRIDQPGIERIGRTGVETSPGPAARRYGSAMQGVDRF